MTEQYTQTDFSGPVRPGQTALPEPIDWHPKMACHAVGVDPELFDPPKQDELWRELQDRERAAKAICKTCPVAVLCLDETIRQERAFVPRNEVGPQFGVRSGLNREERGRLTSSYHASRAARKPR